MAEAAPTIRFRAGVFGREIRKPDEGLLQMLAAIGSQIGQFTERKRAEKEREDLIRQLQDALANLKTLKGLLPICVLQKDPG